LLQDIAIGRVVIRRKVIHRLAPFTIPDTAYTSEVIGSIKLERHGRGETAPCPESQPPPGIVVVEFVVEVVHGVAEGRGYEHAYAVFHSVCSIPLEHDSNSPMCMDEIYHHFTGRNSILPSIKVAHILYHVKLYLLL